MHSDFSKVKENPLSESHISLLKGGSNNWGLDDGEECFAETSYKVKLDL